MKARQISKVIGEKIAELAKAHPEISGVLLKNSIVTGGCIASMLLKEKVNDFDIYFDDLNSMLDVIQYFGMKTGAEYLVAFRPTNRCRKMVESARSTRTIATTKRTKS